MVIHEYKGAEVFTYGETINVSSVYLEGYEGNAPVGLIEGIADYTILKANYYPPSYAGMGDRWDQGYDFTARFLEYCEGIRPGFVAALNRKMKDNFSVGFFDELLGKPCDELWREYKEKYGYRVERNVSGYLNDRSREYKDRYEPMPRANVRVPRTTALKKLMSYF
ncbi:Basic secretory protease [Actinidia chinensis var. chinensis]|uniref:Basic secretory protease n=1 Tax=Actinidia chinensis var. chinensis TaxID=1590841 RepID=A0A2R6Q5X0_ACTCC|nr:Basic secretory protease [Actinidia chinensis var. chinensis]